MSDRGQTFQLGDGRLSGGEGLSTDGALGGDGRAPGERRPRVIIIGGGIAGLSAAYTLATDQRARALGIASALIEEDHQLGGKIRTERIGDCLIENGPDSFLATKPWAAELCWALGLGDRLVGTRPGQPVYVAWKDRLHPLPDGAMFGIPTRLGPVARSRLFSPVEKLRMAMDLVLPRGRGADESIGGLLRRRLGDAAVDRLAGPLLGGIYAGDADTLSVRATFPKLVEWEAQYRSLILAALARRRQPTAPSSRAPSAMFLSLAGGLGEMIDRLAASLGETAILTGRRVTRLIQQPGRSTCCYGVLLEDGTRLDADALVLGTPAYVTARLLEPLAPSAAGRLRNIPYVSTAAVTLAYRRQDIRHPLDGNGFVVAHGEPLNITACTWISSKWPYRAPADIALLRCFLGAAGSEAVAEEDDHRLGDLARADLRAIMGIDATPVFVSVTRWPAAMPQYPPGHLERLEAVERDLQGAPGIVLAGAGYRGIGIPDCIRQGAEAARRLTELLGSEDHTKELSRLNS